MCEASDYGQIGKYAASVRVDKCLLERARCVLFVFGFPSILGSWGGSMHHYPLCPGEKEAPSNLHKTLNEEIVSARKTGSFNGFPEKGAGLCRTQGCC